MIEMLIRLCSCHVQADLRICQSGFSFYYEDGKQVISVPHTIKVCFVMVRYDSNLD